MTMLQPEARPAEPLLASSLLGEEELRELAEGICNGGLKKKRIGESRVGTGVKNLDDALDGGLLSGSVVCVSGEGTGATEVCRTLLVTSLLQYPQSTAAVIDATGNFDVLRLYTLILSQLQRGLDILASVRTATKSEAEATIEDIAAKILDHVKIMRVFDFVGVREAISEIRDDLECRKSSNQKKERRRDEPAREEKSPSPELQPMSKRTVVADSEDEEDEEEMLFDTSAPPPDPITANQQSADDQRQQVDNTQHTEALEMQEGNGGGKVKFLLIDNLAQVINPLLKKDYLAANALASTFLQSLNHQTRTHNLHTVLANPATHPRALSPQRQAPSNSNMNQPAPLPPPPPEHQKHIPPPPPSIFASNSALPSLASVLPRYVDVSLLVSQLPRKKMDAKVFYRDGNDGARGMKRPRGVEMVGVLEVVSDRWEGRVGAWGTFVESASGIQGLS